MSVLTVSIDDEEFKSLLIAVESFDNNATWSDSDTVSNCNDFLNKVEKLKKEKRIEMDLKIRNKLKNALGFDAFNLVNINQQKPS